MTKVFWIVKQCGNFSDALDNLSLGHSMDCFSFFYCAFFDYTKEKDNKEEEE